MERYHQHELDAKSGFTSFIRNCQADEGRFLMSTIVSFLLLWWYPISPHLKHQGRMQLASNETFVFKLSRRDSANFSLAHRDLQRDTSVQLHHHTSFNSGQHTRYSTNTEGGSAYTDGYERDSQGLFKSCAKRVKGLLKRIWRRISCDMPTDNELVSAVETVRRHTRRRRRRPPTDS